MHKNRSPCTTLPRQRLLEAVQGAQPLHERRGRGAGNRQQPPKNVRTPERAIENGAQAGDKVKVKLHENVVPYLGKPRLQEVTVGEGEDARTVTVVKADVAICDIINRNGRFYPRSCFEAANTAAQADMDEGGLWGLCDHPEWWEPMKGSLRSIAAKWTGLAIEDGREIEWPPQSGQTKIVSMVVATGTIASTEAGDDIAGLLRDGIRVGISTNGMGSAVLRPAKELDPNFYDPDALIPYVQDDFRYLSIDFVSDPSNLGGRAQTEGVDDEGDEDDLDPPEQPIADEPPVVVGNPEVNPVPAFLKESPMNPILQALCTKHGKTLEQIKTEHATEYLAALEQIAAQPQPVTEGASGAAGVQQPGAQQPGAQQPGAETGVSAEQFRTLQNANLAQEGRIAQLEGTLVNERRDRMVERALAAANLPRVGVRGEGEGAVDLDRAFEQDLVREARAAESDEVAGQRITRAIDDRRHLTRHLNPGAGQERGPFDHLNRESAGGVQLPVTGTDGAASAGTEVPLELQESLSRFL